MNKHTAFSANTRLAICLIHGNVNPSLYPDSYEIFSGDHMRGWRLAEDLESLEEMPAVPYTLNKNTIDADGIDNCTISNLPEGTVLIVMGESEEETNGTIDFQTDLAGTYELTLTHPLHLDTIIEVTAV